MANRFQSLREAFLSTLFHLLGQVAVVDGPVRRREKRQLQVIIKRMHLPEDNTQQLLEFFNAGMQAEFDLPQALADFKQTTTPKLIQILLVYLISMARADGPLCKAEMYLVQRIARELGYKSIVFPHLLRMISEQDEMAAKTMPADDDDEEDKGLYQATQFPPGTRASDPPGAPQGAQYSAHSTGNRRTRQAPIQSEPLHKAYKILGASAEMTDDEIRRAYKKLASQYHPDKLNLPSTSPEQQHINLERFKRIQVAYSFIKKYRSLYSAK